MAVKQEGALRQPPDATQPEQAPGTTSDTQAAPGAQPQTEQEQGQEPGAESDFSQTLAQQVAQAIQPVLDDFRQQVTQTLQHQAEAMSDAGPTGPTGPSAPSAQPSAQESQAAQPAAAERTQQPSGQVAQAAQQAPAKPSAVAEALQPVLKTVERDGKEWLQAMLVAGLTMLLSEPTRAAIQQRTDQSIHTLAQKAFEAAPGGPNNQEMQAKTEYALQTIVHGSLDTIFGDGMRAAVQSSGQAAIQDSFRGDFSAALSAVVDALKAIAQALINVIRQQWQMLLRLALAIAALAIANALEQS